MTDCRDIIGTLQGDRTQASLETDTIARDQAFSRCFGDTDEASVTELDVARDYGKEDVKDENEEEKEEEAAANAVLEPLPRELEASGVATTQQSRPKKGRSEKRHKSRYRHRNYHLSPTIKEQAKQNRTTRRRRGDEFVKTGKSPRKAKVGQFTRERKRNKAMQRSARVASSHRTSKSKVSRVDESEEVGCLPTAFSCLWMFTMLFQCTFQQKRRDWSI